MNILILKTDKDYTKGEMIKVPQLLGIKLIASGIAIAHKAMTAQKEK